MVSNYSLAKSALITCHSLPLRPTDWVPMRIDDQNRGDVYLEATFYSAVGLSFLSLLPLMRKLKKAPPPQRRPSKLKPTERLWRPPVTPPKDPNSLPSSQSSSRRPSPSGTPIPESLNPRGGAGRGAGNNFLTVPGSSPPRSPGGGGFGHGHGPAHPAAAIQAASSPLLTSQSSNPRVPSILRPTHPKSNPHNNASGGGSAPGIPDFLQPRMNNREADLPMDLYPNEPPLPNPFDQSALQQPPNRSRPSHSLSPPRQRIQDNGYGGQNSPPSRHGVSSPPRQQPLPRARMPDEPMQSLPQPGEGLSRSSALNQSPPRGRQHQQAQAQQSSSASQARSEQPERAPDLPPRKAQSPPRERDSELFQRPLSPRSQAKADEEYALAIAKSEGLDIAKMKQEEKDQELARKVWEEEQIDQGRVPGQWSN